MPRAQSRPCPRCNYPGAVQEAPGRPEDVRENWYATMIQGDMIAATETSYLRHPSRMHSLEYELHVHHAAGGYRLLIAVTGDWSIVADPDPVPLAIPGAIRSSP